MVERRLRRQLDKAARRLDHLRLVLGWAAVWLSTAVTGTLLMAFNRTGDWASQPLVMTLGVLAAVAALVTSWNVVRAQRDYRNLARHVEATYPELNACLVTAVNQHPQLPGGHYGYLQERVIQQALDHAYEHTWQRAIPAGRLLSAHVVHFAALIAIVSMFSGWSRNFAIPAVLVDEADSTLLAAGGTFEVSIEPGNTEVERGTSLLVLARFQGALPADVTLHYGTAETDDARTVMTKSLDDPVFGGRIPEIREPMVYRVAFAEQQTAEYHVTVFDYPALERADARLVYPEYTSLGETTVQDVRHVSAVEGTQLTLICHLNKPVTFAELMDVRGDVVPLEMDDGDARLYTADLELNKSCRLTLRLTDLEGRENRLPPEFVLTVLPNQPPELKLAVPARDVEVSPLEELELLASAWDDFGLASYGLGFVGADGEPKEIVLGTEGPGKQKLELKHLLAFEALEANPDELVSYHFWAEDAGPKGDPRRAFSDMFFAEVRPFEEIFRQGQQPPGGSSQQQQQQQQQQNQENSQAGELAELQKQIISGTWNLIRREMGSELSEKFDDDTKLLTESQAGALQQAIELVQQASDAQAAPDLQHVLQHMNSALDHLANARDERQVDHLQAALPSEQAAYQALLKLRAREHEVRQSSSSASRSASRSSSRSQQQLQQLELKNDQNRYETERTAQDQQQNQQDRETRQVLNRLRDLARRQQDLNERIKELQNALEEAQTEEEREQLQRQLKRLREQQEQMLRDTDELLARMEQPENQQQMEQSRQQLQQARENVRQSAEALEQGLVSRAVTSGTRAERELEQLREDFRQQASNRFEEQMRDLRQEARELDERQQELDDQLTRLSDPQAPQKSLRDTGDREAIARGLEQQGERLNDLLEQVRDTVVEAEESEPLLADKLYETYRETEQQQTPRTLQTAARSLDRGLLEDAAERERIAREGVRQFREGVERAAESVLGDETESLRRAEQMVRQLTRQLRNEVDRQSDTAAQSPRDSSSRQDAAAGDNPSGSEQSPSARQQPEQDGQPGSRPPGQRQEESNPGPPRQEAGQQKPSESGQQPSQSPSQRQNDSQSPQQGGRQQASQNSPGQQPGQPGQQPSSEGQPSNSGGRQGSSETRDAAPGQSNSPTGQPNRPDGRQGPRRAALDTGGGAGLQEMLNEVNSVDREVYAPLTGADFLDWSDRLRDVEEMVSDPDLRSDAARIRDRAKEFRRDLRRHSREPNWDLVKLDVVEPLVELRNRLAEEILKRESKDALVPIDRDPVPPRFQEQVRRYYEQLGSGR